jgi:hypothetical protein
MHKMMITLLLALASLPALADFKVSGPLTLSTASGAQPPTNFDFSYTKGADGAVFQAGQLQLAVDEVPKRYTLSLVLTKDSQVWVTDFSKQPLASFQWQIGPHLIKLYKQAQKTAQPGDMVLEVNGFRHFFIAKRPALVHFLFDEHGISELRVEGTFKPKR